MALDSQPIQTIPQGLLGLLQLKNKGQNPDVLLGSVRPTVDLLEQWLNYDRQPLNVVHTISLGSGATGFAGFTTPGALLVPQGQWWYVHHYSVFSAAMVAGNTITGLRPSLRSNVGAPGNRSFVLGNDRGSASPTFRAVAAAHGFWAGPGDELGIWVDGTVFAANATIEAAVLLTPMSV